ncbi:arylacetamide deacetylase-like 3 [Elgaria multicarinata webbii]|uniref:arylacetamide deacetylase-like 3 n=1 Tax=Elgaria multicarinata webbii TaxID=159646 RepID=UPI002FCCE666
MEFGQMLWMLASYVSISILSLVFAWAIYYDITRTHIPPGFNHHLKLRLINFSLNLVFGLEMFLEKLGVCPRHKCGRFIQTVMPPLIFPRTIIKNLVFDEVPVRVYWPTTPTTNKRRAMVYLHGGVGVHANLKTHARLCNYIARKSGSVVVCVRFRYAPEHPYPVPVLDCCTATIHLLKNAERYGVDPNHIIVGGDSSGGTFAAAVCHELATRKDLPRVRAQVLLYPFLQAVDFNLPSYQQSHSIPLSFQKRIVRLGLLYLTGRNVKVDEFIRGAHVPEELRVKYRKWVSADIIPEEFKVRGYVPPVLAPFSKEHYEVGKQAFEPMFSPLLAEDAVIRQLPATFILTCEYDVLRDDGLLYKKRLEDNGVPVTWHHVKDGFHGISMFVDLGLLEFPSSRSSCERVIHFLECL